MVLDLPGLLLILHQPQELQVVGPITQDRGRVEAVLLNDANEESSGDSAVTGCVVQEPDAPQPG